MMRNLKRNLMPMVTAVAIKSKSIWLNKPTIIKKMRPSPPNLPAVPSWQLPLS